MIDSIQKNDGINISIPVEICIEKSTGIGQHFFPQQKLTRDEGIKLERAFWEMIYMSNDKDLALFDFLKLCFRMCTNINNHVPIRHWFGDPDEKEQWGYGYRDDMIAQFEQDLCNKNFTLQDQGKDDPIDTLENRIKFWIKIISNDEGSIPEKFMVTIITTKGLIILFVVGSVKNFLREKN